MIRCNNCKNLMNTKIRNNCHSFLSDTHLNFSFICKIMEVFSICDLPEWEAIEDSERRLVKLCDRKNNAVESTVRPLQGSKHFACAVISITAIVIEIRICATQLHSLTFRIVIFHTCNLFVCKEPKNEWINESIRRLLNPGHDRHSQ